MTFERLEHHVLVAEPERVEISQRDDGWYAECLVCHSWVTRNHATRGAAEIAFAQHLRNDYPHNLDEQSPPLPPT